VKKLAVALLLAGTLEARPIVFTNVNVITMTGDSLLRRQVVIVDDGKIVALGAEGTVPIPDDGQRIDGQGGTILPGLIDLHVHVTQPDDLPLYVANGVTTVLNLSGDRATLGLRGQELGPRVLTSGKPVIGVESAERARAIVDEHAAAGFDAVKIYDKFSIEALNAIVGEARAKGLLSVGHIPRNLRWQDMLAARPDAIAHAEEFLYSPVLDGDGEKIVRGMKDGGVSLITTLITYDTIGRQVADLETLLSRGENAYVNPAIARMWERPHNHYIRDFTPARVPNLRRLLGFQKSLVRQLEDGGVTILAGTDAGGPPFVFPGGSLIDELRELVSAGLTPYQALRAATIDAARFLRMGDAFGTIEAGKSADFILVRGNPLTNIDDLLLRSGVMLRGRWLDNAALHAELDRIARANEAEKPVVATLDRGVPELLAALKTHPVRESTLNELAYQVLLIDKKPEEAVRLFRINVKLHPESWQAKESLEEAIAALRKANSGE
jgi:amidohydrolase family protein